MKRAEKVVNVGIDHLAEIEVTHILSTTALEILSYAHPLQEELKNLMLKTIDWNSSGAANRIHPDELEGVFTGAEAEVANGFQRLSFQALVSLWTGLEVMIEDLFVAWILDFPDRLEHEAFQKLKIQFSEFLRLDEESRIRELYYEFVAQTHGTKSHGISRFEVILKPLGLSGLVDQDVSQAVYELQLLRNLIAHQNGKVDKKFLKSDFGNSYKLGDTIYIYERRFRDYCAATISYAETILDRIKTSV